MGEANARTDWVRIAAQLNARRGQRLEYGFALKGTLDGRLLESIARSNAEYCDTVWGRDDSADNAVLCEDELDLLHSLSPLLVDGSALEVGCGSGRLTAQLALACSDLVAIDVSLAATERCRSRFRESDLFHPDVRHCDVLDLPGTRHFSLVLALENFLGMSPCAASRAALIRACGELAVPGGVCIFGFRVRNGISEGNLLLQALPYPDDDMKTSTIGAVTVNWSRSAAEAEVRSVLGERRLTWKLGGARPAGGCMDFLLVSDKQNA